MDIHAFNISLSHTHTLFTQTVYLLFRLHTHTRCLQVPHHLLLTLKFHLLVQPGSFYISLPTAYMMLQNGGWVCCVGIAALDKQPPSTRKHESKAADTSGNSA